MDTINTILATCPLVVEAGEKVRIDARPAPMVREAISALQFDEAGLRSLARLPRPVYMALMRKCALGFSIVSVAEDADSAKLRVFMARNQQPPRAKRTRAPRKVTAEGAPGAAPVEVA